MLVVATPEEVARQPFLHVVCHELLPSGGGDGHFYAARSSESGVVEVFDDMVGVVLRTTLERFWALAAAVQHSFIASSLVIIAMRHVLLHASCVRRKGHCSLFALFALLCLRARPLFHF